MGTFWLRSGTFKSAPYVLESELESAVVLLSQELFGSKRIYLDVKRKIGSKSGIRNIPDGYLIDLTGKTPRLFVVENELAAHDPLRHIAVQILQFSLSFESEPRTVRKILFESLENQVAARRQCEAYAADHHYRNLDHMLDWLVFESNFAALVIIDEIPENLEAILARKFQFGVEVLELARFKNASGEVAYYFEPFLADLEPEQQQAGSVETEATTRPLIVSDLDTVVVPAREGGFESVFLGENRWHSVRIHGSMRNQIKYIAGYQVAPVSAITYIAPIKSIEPWKDSGKYVINFAEAAKKITPIPLVKNGSIKNFQSLRYANRERLLNAKSMDEIWFANH